MGNVIPTNRIDPTAQALLTYMPMPNRRAARTVTLPRTIALVATSTSTTSALTIT